jgi:hypothetical protein
MMLQPQDSFGKNNEISVVLCNVKP